MANVNCESNLTFCANSAETGQGNRIIPKEQQVPLAKRPNGALHTSPGQRPGNIAQYNARRSEGTPHIPKSVYAN